jgi:hypothetical protein
MAAVVLGGDAFWIPVARSISQLAKSLAPILGPERARDMSAFFRSPDNSAASVTAFVVGLVIPLLLVLICGRRSPPRRPAAPAPSALLSADVPAGGREGLVLVCRICDVPLEPDMATRHVEGKKHLKAAAKAESAASPRPTSTSSPFLWMPANKAPAPAKKAAAAAAQRAFEDSDDEDARGRVPVTSASTAAAAAARAAGEGVQLQGKKVVAVFEQSGVDHSGGDGEAWTSAGGGGGGGKKGGPSSSSSSSSTSGGGGKVLSSLFFLEGGRNILEGLAVQDNALAPGGENVLLAAIDDLIRAGQGKRLRGQTYAPSRDGFPSALHFGCFYSWADQEVVPTRSVEPVPPTLKDFCRKIAARGPALGSSITALPTSVSVYDLHPGQFLPPHILAAPFPRPSYILTIGCSDEGEDLLMGLRIGALEGATQPGEFVAGFAHRLRRRSLVCIGGVSGTMAQHAIPAVRARCILVVFRHMPSSMLAEMQARGNAV